MVQPYKKNGFLFWLFLLTVSLLIFSPICIGKNEETSLSLRKEELQRLCERRGSLLTLNLAEYRQYVLKGDRDYNVVLILSVDSADCQHCRLALKMFKDISRAYQQRGLFNDQPKKTPVLSTFFVVVDVLKERQLVELHNLESVPMIAFISPNVTFKKIPIPNKEDRFYIPIPTEALLSTVPQNQNLEQAIINWIDYRVGVSSPTILSSGKKENTSDPIMALLLILLVSGIAYIGFIIARKSPKLIATIAVVIYILAGSGLCFTIIHGVPFVGYDQKTRKTKLFHTQSRYQYGLEGIIGSTCSTLCGILFLAAGYMINKNPFKRKIHGYIVALIFALAGIGMYRFVSQIRTAKDSRDQNVPFFPWNEYVKGPLARDRGNTLL